VREQELLRVLAASSTLPVLDLDVSDDDVPAAADRIADWLEETGGLSSPWGVPELAPPG
jgi:hypothetical protein